MNKFLLSIIFSFAFTLMVQANEIIQISDEVKPHYLITVKHGDTPLGTIELEAFTDAAPKHCHNLDSLVGIKFYDGTAFHRVIPGFVIQGGDPNSKNKPKSTWGYGDPSQTTVPAEFSSTLKHLRGTLSAARAQDPNSATSQFFICIGSLPTLDNKYSIYGQVVKGIDIVDKIVSVPRDANDNPNLKVEMTIVKLDMTDVNEKEFNSGNIKIYPNPTSNNISFMLENSDIFVNSIYITDINGKKYFEQNYSNNTNISDISIPVNNYLSGVYYIYIKEISGKEYILRFVLN
jgi:peptidyl-prolyl cis-trans isomerase B (cyclophilin B)